MRWIVCVKNVENGKDLLCCRSECFDLALGTINKYIKDGKVLPQLSMTQYKQDYSMAEEADKLSRSNSVAAALSVDWFLISFFFILEIFS